MKRLTEEMRLENVLAPQSVAASTLTATKFVDAAGAQEVTFLISGGALASGKKLTVQLVASDASAGTSAVTITEQVFTAGAGVTAALAAVSYRPSAEYGRYVGVKFKHDSSDAVICGATAQLRMMSAPAESGWKLEV